METTVTQQPAVTNFITDEEAQERACCHPSSRDRPYACMGSGCMAWRWVAGQKGYCGMAGGPAEVMVAASLQMVEAVRS